MRVLRCLGTSNSGLESTCIVISSSHCQGTIVRIWRGYSGLGVTPEYHIVPLLLENYR